MNTYSYFFNSPDTVTVKCWKKNGGFASCFTVRSTELKANLDTLESWGFKKREDHA